MQALPRWAVDSMAASAMSQGRTNIGPVPRRQTFGIIAIEFIQYPVLSSKKRHVQIVPENPKANPDGRYRLTFSQEKQPKGMSVDHVTAVITTSLVKMILTFNGHIYDGSLCANRCHGNWDIKKNTGTISILI